MKTDSVSVIIPTFNGLKLLQAHLPSIFSALRSGDQVLVADDASSDQTVAWLLQTYGLEKIVAATDYDVWQAELIQPLSFTFTLVINHQNLRFGATANRGVALAESPLVFLINSDVGLRTETLTHLVLHFQDPQVFAVGCHELEKTPDQSAKISGGKNRLWFGRGLFWHGRAPDYETGETAWASGGSAMFDRKKWLELGGFAEAYYPAYWEDVDLSYRARQQGWKVLFEAQAMVDHNHETTNQDVFGQPQIVKMSQRNARVFTWRNGNVAQKISFLFWFPYYWLRK